MKKVSRHGLAAATALALVLACNPAIAADDSTGGQVMEEIRKGLSGISKYFWSPSEPAPSAPAPAVKAAPEAAQSGSDTEKATAATPEAEPAPAAAAAAKPEPAPAPAAEAAAKPETVPAPAAEAAPKPESTPEAVEPAPATAAAEDAGKQEVAKQETAKSAESAAATSEDVTKAPAAAPEQTTAAAAVERSAPPATGDGTYVWLPERGSELEPMFATGIPAQILKANGELGRTDGRWAYCPTIVGAVPDIGSQREQILDAADKGAWIGEGANSVYVFEKGKTYEELVGAEAAAAAPAEGDQVATLDQQRIATKTQPIIPNYEEIMGGMNPLTAMKGSGEWTSVNGRWLYLPHGKEDMTGMGGMEGMAALAAAAPAAGGWMQRNGRWAYVAPSAGQVAALSPLPGFDPENSGHYVWQPRGDLGGGEWLYQPGPAGVAPSPWGKWSFVDGRRVFLPGGDADMMGMGGMEGMAALVAAAPAAGGWVMKNGRWAYVAPGAEQTGMDGMSGVKGMTADAGQQGMAGMDGMSGMKGMTADAGQQGMAGMDSMSGMSGMQGMSAGAGQWTSVAGRWVYLPKGQDDMTGMGGMEGMSALVAGSSMAGGWMEKNGRWAYIAPGVAAGSNQTGMSGMDGMSGMKGMTADAGQQGMAGMDGMSGMSGMQGMTADSGQWTSVNGRWVFLPNGQGGMGGMEGMAALVAEASMAGGWVQRNNRWAYVAAEGATPDMQGMAGMTGMSGMQGMQGMTAGSGMSGMSGMTGMQGAVAEAGQPARDGHWTSVDGRWVYLPQGEAQGEGIIGTVGLSQLVAGASAQGGWLQSPRGWMYVAPTTETGGSYADAVPTDDTGAPSAGEQQRVASADAATAAEAEPQNGAATGHWERRGDTWVHVDDDAAGTGAADGMTQAEAPADDAAVVASVPQDGEAQATMPGIAVVGADEGGMIDDADGRKGLAEETEAPEVVEDGRVTREYGIAPKTAPDEAYATRSAALPQDDTRSDAAQEAAGATSGQILFFVPGQVPGTGTWYTGSADILASAKPVYNPAFAGGR